MGMALHVRGSRAGLSHHYYHISFHIVGLCVRAVSVLSKKSDAVCGFLAYFCAVLRFSDPPYAPLFKLLVFSARDI